MSFIHGEGGGYCNVSYCVAIMRVFTTMACLQFTKQKEAVHAQLDSVMKATNENETAAEVR